MINASGSDSGGLRGVPRFRHEHVVWHRNGWSDGFIRKNFSYNFYHIVILSPKKSTDRSPHKVPTAQSVGSGETVSPSLEQESSRREDEA